MKRSEESRVLPFTPRGLSRELAALYIGVGTTLFDEMVADGRMPKPKRINSRVIWDRFELDAAFSDIPPATNGLRELIEASPRVKHGGDWD